MAGRVGTNVRSWLVGCAGVLAIVGLTFGVMLAISPILVAWLGLGSHGAADDMTMQAHYEVLRVLALGSEFSSDSPWQQREQEHFHDVARLIRWAELVVVLAVGILAFAVWRFRDEWSSSFRCFLYIMVAGVMVDLVLLSQWTLSNRLLHPLVFPQGNWSFPSDRFLMTRLYHAEFLVGFVIGWLVLLAAVMAGLLWRWRQSGQGNPFWGSYWTWIIRLPKDYSRWWLVLVVLALGATFAVGYWFGMQTVHPWDLGHFFFYVVVLFLCLGFIGFLQKNRLVLLLALALASLAGQSTAVRLAMNRAQSELVTAQSVVDAIYAEYQISRRWPRDISAVQELQQLPAVTTGEQQWYFRPYPGHAGFVIGFVGPLGYHYNWRTNRNDGRGGWRVPTYRGVP